MRPGAAHRARQLALQRRADVLQGEQGLNAHEPALDGGHRGGHLARSAGVLRAGMETILEALAAAARDAPRRAPEADPIPPGPVTFMAPRFHPC